MKIKIGTDSGIGNTKAALVLEDKKVITTVFPTTAKIEESKDGRFVTYFESNRYVVGEVNDTLTTNDITTSKLTDTHKVATLTAIVALIEKAKLRNTDIDEVELTINIPLNLYKDTKEREKALRFYNQDNVAIKVNGKEYEFNLRVTPYFEGMGIAIRNNALMGEREAVVIDFGTLNVNVATFGRNKKPIGTKSVCLGKEFGCKSLIIKIQEELEPMINQTLSVESTIDAIQGKLKGLSKEEISVVEKIVHEHLQNIYGRLAYLGIDLKFSDVIVAGGGALLMKDYIKKVFGEEIVIEEDPLFANAIGTLHLIEKK